MIAGVRITTMQPSAPRIPLLVGYRSGLYRYVSIPLLVPGAILTVGCGCVGAFILDRPERGGRQEHLGQQRGAGARRARFRRARHAPHRPAGDERRAGRRLAGGHPTHRGQARLQDRRPAGRPVGVVARLRPPRRRASPATARLVTTGAVTRTPGILTVSTDTGTVKLGLRSRESLLIPPPEMYALAAALDTARCPGAAEAAGWLRAMAADPRTMLL